MSLAQALQTLQLNDKVESLRQHGLLFHRMAAEVIKGTVTLDQALALTRLGKWKSDPQYRKCHFENYVEQHTSVGVAVVGKKIIMGEITAHDKYDLTIKTQDAEQPILIHKHDIKFYFDAGDKKQVIKHVTWGPKDLVVEQDSLKEIKKRHDVKAKVLMSFKDGEKAITWHTPEWDQSRGKVPWHRPWEGLLAPSRRSPVGC